MRGLKLAYVGDGNNVCHSLLATGARVGAHVRDGHAGGLRAGRRRSSRRRKRDARGHARARSRFCVRRKKPWRARRPFTPTSGPAWARKRKPQRARPRSRRYQVNAELMSQAAPDAVFLHCLPAHRGSEVTDEVMDSPRSIVFDQAENRLHVQKAILLSSLN